MFVKSGAKELINHNSRTIIHNYFVSLCAKIKNTNIYGLQ